jgi:hypothetical protein
LDVLNYFCDLGRTDAFAYLFQLYNFLPRAFAAFTGPDPVPQELARLIGEVKDRFDHLVIATPYHELAAAEWGETSWPFVHCDPFLFGFLRQVPAFVFLLGRWSGTGLFPLIPEMIAATLLHLRAHRHLLATARIGQLSWYKAEAPVWPSGPREPGPPLRPVADHRPGGAGDWREERHSLVRFAGQVWGHFEAGSLFPWLRGEKVRKWTVLRG